MICFSYVVIKDTTHPVNISAEAEAAAMVLFSYGEKSAVVWESPISSDESIEQNSRKTSRLIFAPSSPTRSQLWILRASAEFTGDQTQIDLCDLALDGNQEAFNVCAAVIAATQTTEAER
jgi:hypothetical protein